MKTERYAMVEIHAFGDGMRKLFEGVAEVFASMGVTDTDVLDKAASQWNNRHPEKTNQEKMEAESNKTSDTSTDETAVENSVAGSQEATGTGTDNKGTPEPENKDNAESEAPTASKAEPKSETIAEEKSAKKPKKVEKAEKPAKASVTQDDITAIIVQKIKKDRSNNEKIGGLLRVYGAARVSELPEEKYEAFLTDISAI